MVVKINALTDPGLIDALLAAFCLQRGYALLHADRDFDAYATHHGLHCWRGVT